MIAFGRFPQSPSPRVGLTVLALTTVLALGQLNSNSRVDAQSLSGSSQLPIEIENLRVGFEEYYKVGAFTPVKVQLRAGADRFTGFVEVVVPDDDDVPTSTRQGFDAPAGQSVTVVLYVRPGSTNSDWSIRVYDRDGRRVRVPVPEETLRQLKPLYMNQVCVGTLGNPQGVNLLTSLPEYQVPSTPNAPASAQDGIVTQPIRLPDGLPGRPLGFEGLDAVVIDTSSTEAMQALGGGRGEAIREWVRRGGHLVVGVSSRWQAVRDSVLAEMLPAVPNGLAQINDFGALETYAGSNIPVTPAGGDRVSVCRLEQVEKRGGKVLDATAATPLIVRGSFGFGRVTVLAMDVDQPPFSTWEDRNKLWAKLLDLRPLNLGATDQSGGAFYSYNVTDLSTRLGEALNQFPGVKLVPFAWVAFFIFVYILLIGPGDYFFLKKVLKRMELTWVTFPIIVLTVSLLAYYSAYAIKGTDLRINKLDVVDIDTLGNRVRGTTWATIFSPQNRDYQVSLSPRPVPSNPEEAQAASASLVATSDRPTPLAAGVEAQLTWFGIPERSFGGMNNPNRLGLSSIGYSYEPMGEYQAISGLRIPIWSSKRLMARWTASLSAEGPAQIESELVRIGADRLGGTVTNRSGLTLKNAIVAFGNQLWELGNLSPGANIRVETITNQFLSGYLDRQAQMFRGQGGRRSSNPADRVDRGRLARVMMFREGMEAKSDTPPSRVMHDLDLSGLLKLDRPMLVAELDGSAAQLLLGGAPSTPQVDQTTLVRWLLPVQAEGGSSR